MSNATYLLHPNGSYIGFSDKNLAAYGKAIFRWSWFPKKMHFRRLHIRAHQDSPAHMPSCRYFCNVTITGSKFSCYEKVRILSLISVENMFLLPLKGIYI